MEAEAGELTVVRIAGGVHRLYQDTPETFGRILIEFSSANYKEAAPAAVVWNLSSSRDRRVAPDVPEALTAEE